MMINKKILAIDDSLDNLITIKAVLKIKFPNYTLLTALSGEEGIEIAKKEALHLIILDIIMPKLDGFETLKILKSTDATKDIPVLLLTAIKSDVESRVKGLALGADAFLSKPIDIEELTAYIQVALRSKEKINIAQEKSINLEKLVHKKLSEIEFQATVLRNIADAVITTDLNFNITTWNHVAENIYGWKAVEAIGNQIDDFLKTDYINTTEEEILNELETNQFIKGELNLQHKDGRILHIYRSSSVLKNQEGNVIGYVSLHRDFTYRKKAELELIAAKEKAVESKKLLNYFFKQSMSGVFFMMLDKPIDWNDRIDKEKTLDYIFKHQKVTKANKAILQQYGATLEQFIGYTPADFFKHNMADGRKIWSDFFDKGILHIDTNEKKFDGTDMIVEGDYKCIYNDKNQIIGHFGIQNDVTTIRYAENELKKLSTAIVQSPVSIFITNLEGTIEYANPKVTEITGYELSEIIGQNPRLFSSKEKSKDEYKELWNALIAGKVWYGEFHNKRKNGELFWESASISPIVDKTGKTTHYLAVKEDITHQKELLNNLQHAKEKAEEHKLLFEGLFNNATIGLYQTTPDGQILSANPTLIKLLKFDSLEDLMSRDLSKGSYIDQEKREQFKTVLAEKGEIIGFESEWQTKDGEIRVVLESARVAKNEKGEIIRYDGVVENVSEKMQLINDLNIAKEKAEESDRLKSAFLANMSHEIRTPMNSILGFSELLTNENLSQEKKENYYKIVNNSGNRLLNLINDIVDISKIEANQLTLNFTTFNLNNVLDTLQSQFEISPLRKNVTIKIAKTLSTENSFIHCDNTRLTQVLSNLIENALKFTENGTIEIGYIINDSEIQFFVKDNGVGINKTHLKLIFERFRQSDNQFHKAKLGTGLGLSISKGIVDAFGGKIWVESEPYQGATFYFTIPNCIVQNIEIKKELDQSLEIKTKKTPTILIAEDEESNYWFLEAVLEKYDFHLLHAENGKETVHLFQNHKVDLILMDFNMPIMSGIEATEIIRKTNKEIPIIALTAYAMAEDEDRAYAAGCTNFLSKPINRNLLLETIKNYLK